MSLLHDILLLWHRITEDHNETDSFQCDDWTLRTMNREIEEALTLDPSDTTALLLLDSFVHTYLDHRTFSVNSLLADQQSTASNYLASCRELYTLLNHPSLTTIRTRFHEQLQRALTHYAPNRPDVQGLIEDRYALPLLRRDALKSFQQLSRYHFLDGPTDSAPIQYLPTLYRFWNINSLLRTAVTWPNSLSLHLIQDPDVLQSYFVFVCRQGGRLIVVTDRPDHNHPLQRFMTRRPDRQFADRAWRHHFPYDLLDVTITEDERVRFHTQTGVVRYGHTGSPLITLPELAPDQLLWVLMLFDLFADHLLPSTNPVKSLAYTGEMIVTPTSLIDAARATQLPVRQLTPLSLPPITVDDLQLNRLTETQIGEQPSQHCEWMAQRYQGQVKQESLALIGDQTNHYALDSITGQLVTLTADDYEHHPYALRVLDPTTFQTKSLLEADRLFLARYNFAVHVKRCAELEYERRRTEVLEWVATAVSQNLPALLESIGHGTFIAPRHFRFPQFGQDFRPSPVNILTVTKTKPHRAYDLDRGVIHLHGGTRGEGLVQCVMNQALATTMVEFRPPDVGALALLCNRSIQELPDVLQYWHAHGEEPYVGNSILDRIDPMEWVPGNPWSQLSFRVHISLSTGSYNQLKRNARRGGSENAE